MARKKPFVSSAPVQQSCSKEAVFTKPITAAIPTRSRLKQTNPRSLTLRMARLNRRDRRQNRNQKHRILDPNLQKRRRINSFASPDRGRRPFWCEKPTGGCNQLITRRLQTVAFTSGTTCFRRNSDCDRQFPMDQRTF